MPIEHHPPIGRLTLVIGGVVIAIPGVLYFFTAARDIVTGDTTELTIGAVTLGVAHPPGYPLFTMLGHLFSLLPTGPVPFRVNLLSVVCDSLTVGVVFLTGLRLSRSYLAAAIGALILALNPLFWSWSLVAEVFPLNNLLASVLIYLVVIWYESPERIGVLAAAAFVAGLALTNHHTIVLLGPAVCFVLWQRRRIFQARPQGFVICAAAFVLGLLPYAYILWAAARHPAYNWGGVSSLGDLFAVVTRQSYGTFHLAGASHQGGSALDRVLALAVAFGAMMGLLSVLGLVRAYRHHRSYFWFSLLALICTGPLFAMITNLNLASTPQTLLILERFFLLPEVVAAPLLALGIIAIAKMLGSYAPKLPIQALSIVIGVLTIILAAGLFKNYRHLDQSANRVARSYAEDVFRTIEPNTILLATGDGLSVPMLYMDVVERTRPDVTFILPLLLPADWYVRQLRERHLDFVVPFDHYDLRRNNLKTLIGANPRRPIAVIGNIADNSLDSDYWAYRYGLVTRVEPRSKRIALSQMVSDTEELMQRYRPPSSGLFSPKSFESEILSRYAEPAWQIAKVYESNGRKEEAREWYQSALEVDPNFLEARRGLERTR